MMKSRETSLQLISLRIEIETKIEMSINLIDFN